MEMAKGVWIEGQCQEVGAYLGKNNSKKAYQLVKDLNKEKHCESPTIQERLTEDPEILER